MQTLDSGWRVRWDEERDEADGGIISVNTEALEADLFELLVYTYDEFRAEKD